GASSYQRSRTAGSDIPSLKLVGPKMKSRHSRTACRFSNLKAQHHRSACCSANAPSHGNSKYSPWSALIESTAHVKKSANPTSAPTSSHMKSNPMDDAKKPASRRTIANPQKKTL